MGKKVINTERFINFLSKEVETIKTMEEKKLEKNSPTSLDYAEIMMLTETRHTYEFILRLIESDPTDDPADFMEEVDEE